MSFLVVINFFHLYPRLISLTVKSSNIIDLFNFFKVISISGDATVRLRALRNLTKLNFRETSKT
jgi:hypothetical protein